MAANMSAYLAKKLLDHSVGKAAYTMPTAYAALHTADPTDAGTGAECNYTSYARVATSAATWAAATGSSTASTTTVADISFPTSTGGTNTAGWVALWDAVTAGNLLWHGPLSLAKSIASGDTPKVSTGDLDLTLD
jgi:hypothetical protein